MADWTTKVLSEYVGIDLHPDLDSFPAKLTTINPYHEHLQGILLSKKEAHALMLALIEHFGGVYSTG